MSVSRTDVEQIARLAELRVDEDAVAALAEQLSAILAYVEQLGELPAGEAARPFGPGPEAIRLRPDEVRPWPLAMPPAEFAPAFRQGFFTVPRLGQFGEESAEDDE